MIKRELNQAGHSTGQTPILKQQLAMSVGMGMGRSSALVYNEWQNAAFVQRMNNLCVMPSNKGTQREA